MAGGMRRRGQWGPLAERTAATRPSPFAEPAPPSPESDADPGPVVKPCWVTDRHGRQPGLLLEWGRRDGRYIGRVVRPVRDTEGWLVVEEWLPADLLEPAAPDPRS